MLRSYYFDLNYRIIPTQFEQNIWGPPNINLYRSESALVLDVLT